MRAFIFPGQGSQAVGMGAALAEASAAARAVFQEVDEALGQTSVPADGRGAGGRADADRECPAGDHGERHRDACACWRGKAACGWPTRRISSRAIRWANIPRCARRGRSTWRPRRGCSSCAGRRCRRRCRWARARWRRCSAPIWRRRRRSPERGARGEGEVCTVANDNDPSQVVISGHDGAIERAIALAKEHGRQARGAAAGVRAVPLPADAARRRRDGGGAGRGATCAAPLVPVYRQRRPRRRSPIRTRSARCWSSR